MDRNVDTSVYGRAADHQANEAAEHIRKIEAEMSTLRLQQNEAAELIRNLGAETSTLRLQQNEAAELIRKLEAENAENAELIRKLEAENAELIRKLEVEISTRRLQEKKLEAEISTRRLRQNEAAELIRKLEAEISTLRLQQRRLMGEELDGMSYSELKELEEQVTNALICITEKKDEVLRESIKKVRKEELRIKEENKSLRRLLTDLEVAAAINGSFFSEEETASANMHT